MSVANPLSITYGDREVGGVSEYQLHGPFTLDKSYATLRLSFVVVVVGASYLDLVGKSDTLEADFRKRLTAGETLRIDLDGSVDTYTVGTTLLHCSASIAKTGRPETDVGYSRAYGVTIEAELPADAAVDAGLRDVEVQVSLSPSRQHTVTMRGVYTATTAGTALENYQSNFDAKAAAYLALVASGATFELVSESYTMDREANSSTPTPHLTTFTRQYLELLVDQALGERDAAAIRDHRVIFTDLAAYPGDGAPDLVRLHRVLTVYECAVDIDETTDLQGVFTDTVRPHVLALFETNFAPRVFAVEDQRVSYDEAGKRISVTLVVVYQGSGGEDLVEVSQSVAVRETRNIDYTPVHGPNELAAYADVGWATKERIWSRTAIVIGEREPASRLSQSTPRGRQADAGFSTVSGVSSPDERGGGAVLATGGIGAALQVGWNTISSTSQSSPAYVGMPGGEQIQLTTLSETIIERYHEAP